MTLTRQDVEGAVPVNGVRRWSGTGWALCDHVSRWDGALWVPVWLGTTVSVSGLFSQYSSGLDMVRDEGVFGINKSPSTSPAITQYQWHFSDQGGQLTLGGTDTADNLKLIGPNYTPNQLNLSIAVEVWCDVTIDGRSYTTPVQTFIYQSSNLI